MFFSEDNHIKLISVLDFNWDYNNVSVAARPYHALSLRLTGNATFSDRYHTADTADNDLLYMPAGTPYHLKSEKEHLIVIHFELEPVEKYSFAKYTPLNAAVFQNCFSDALDVWNKKKPGYYFRAMSILYKIFEQMTRQFFSGYTESQYQKIKNASEYMHMHFYEPQLSVEKLCDLSNLSDTQFRKLFFEIYGTTPIKYINQLRIDYAANLLDSSFFTIEQIALKSGFTDSKYFSTVFKKYRCFSPSVCRNNRIIK